MLLAASMLPLCGMRLDVRDFGAKGDGVADDFAAIQHALNKAEEYRKADTMIYANNLGKIPGWGVWEGGNQEVFLPKGMYRISRILICRPETDVASAFTKCQITDGTAKSTMQI